jgi:ATP-grasp domain
MRVWVHAVSTSTRIIMKISPSQWFLRSKNLRQPRLAAIRSTTTSNTSTYPDEEGSGSPISDLNELTVLGIEHVQGLGTSTLTSEDPYMTLPSATLMVVAETEVVLQATAGDDESSVPYYTMMPNSHGHFYREQEYHRNHNASTTTTTPSLMSCLTEMDFATFDTNQIVVRDWDREKKYSDLICDGVQYLQEEQREDPMNNHAVVVPTCDDDDNDNDDDASSSNTNPPGSALRQRRHHHNKHNNNIVMLFESPSTSTTNAAFTNITNYRFHDWPPLKNTRTKGILGPSRYASMNGNALPVFLREDPPMGLVDHWQKHIPGFIPPTFVPDIQPDQAVYAFLPVESIDNTHVNDPSVHYHLAGKDAIHLMTQKTARLLPDTKTVRPCVVKTTHSMGSKGIFIITDDDDEAELERFLVTADHPTFVVTDFVDIDRNVACHFFIHPNGSIVWFGSNENHRSAKDGKFSSDSYLLLKDQDELKRMQLPFVEEVVTYCRSLNFWGFCGIDVLFDSHGQGYLIDINPRVTGSCPALMTLSLLHHEHEYSVGLFRRTGSNTYYGSATELLRQVDAHNNAVTDDSSSSSTRIILHSFLEVKPGLTKINIGVYGNDLDECERILNDYAKPAKQKKNRITSSSSS